MSTPKHGRVWPDPLTAPDPDDVDEWLATFWHRLRRLTEILGQDRSRHAEAADLPSGDENLLAIECLADLRAMVIDMMLALNGIARPAQTVHLNPI